MQSIGQQSFAFYRRRRGTVCSAR